MKHLRALLLALMCLVMVVLCACPSSIPDASDTTTTTTTGSTSGSTSGSSSGSSSGGTVDPSVPLGATFRPSDTGERAGYWKKFSVASGSFGTSDYTQADGALTNTMASPSEGTDLAFGFTAPHDGNYEVGADMLALAAADGEVALAVYKNGSKIWPVSEDAYVATTENGSPRFTATTAAKKGDVFYIRVSGDTTLNISPRVTLVSAGYDENRDIEENFPTVGVLANVGSTILPSAAVMTPVTKPTEGTSFDGVKIGNRVMRNQMQVGEVFFSENDEDIIIDATGRTGTFDGKGAIIVTGGRVEIKGLAEGCEIKNLVIFAAGGVSVSKSTGGVLSGVSFAAELTVGSDVSALTLSDCRIVASGSAIENKSASLTVISSYIEGTSAAIVDAGKGGSLFYNCILKAYHTAAILGASDTTLRRSTVYGDILTDGEAENLLVAQCDVRNVGAILYNKVHNSVVLLCEAENITAKNSTNVYVCENAIYGGLCFDNVRYLIAEDNTLATAIPALVSVKDYNGDNITDITARADVGVNEDLLPHVNKDAHLMMERKESVRTTERKKRPIAEYINETIANDTDLIIAPGAYNAGSGSIRFSGKQNVNIYAYGVLFERTVYDDLAMEIGSSKNIAIYGLTLSISEQSSGQIQVVKKLGDGKLLCLVGAGVSPEWSFDTDNRHEIGYRQDSLSSYGDLGSEFDAKNPPQFDANGFITFTYPELAYEAIQVGDVITCRKGGSLTRFQSSSGIFLEDITIMGGAIRCFWDDYNDVGTTINRAVDTRMPAKIIDKATYDRYKQYEKQYGINTGVYIDEFGNYRGAESRSATADFAHANTGRTGYHVTNSIIDGLTDDGTNNQGSKSRVYGYDIETGKVLIKGDSTWGYGESISSTVIKGKVGDTIHIMTIAGEVITRSTLLSSISTPEKSGGQYTAHFYIEAGNQALADAIERIDPNSNHSTDFKLLCECPETASPNPVFDNVLFKNIRSRACLIKTNGARIENCSFYNIGMAAIALNYEPKYGEGGVPTDATIRNNYFESTGNYEDKAYYSPISVDAPAVQGGEAYMTAHNMIIEGNVMRNRYTAHALYVSGSMNVIVKNNDFGDRYDFAPTYAVYMDFVRDVELSGNIYSGSGETAAEAVALSNYVNVHGDDIDGVWNDRLVTDALYTTTWVENIPYMKGNTLTFKGNWDAGILSTSTLNPSSLVRFNTSQISNRYYTYNNGLWDTSGAVSTIASDYRFATAKTKNQAIRYTMDKDATVAISIAEFFPPHPATVGFGAGDALFAIFVNDEMVWPTAGGSYTSDSDWWYITQTSNLAEINTSLAKLDWELSEGDQILFVAKMPTGGEQSFFAAAPNIYYLK